MTATAPIALEGIEDAIHDWVAAATGIPGSSVTFVETRDSGAPVPEYPYAQIQMIAGPIGLGQPEIRTIPSIVQQRINVSASGPGTFGVLFYEGTSLDPLPIAYVSGAVEDPVTVAAGLHAELVANLPAGYSASVDLADASRIIVDGTDVTPQFALAPENANTSITPLRERFPELECEWSRLTWRVTFYAQALRGFGTATDLLARAKKDMHRVLRPALYRVGWKLSGVLAATPTDPPTRDESQAVLDFALEGYATAAYQTPSIRQAETAFTL